MPIKGEDVYNLAVALYGGLDVRDLDETLMRAAIGRAYYGAFLEARDKARIQNKGGSAHSLVRDHYFNKGRTGHRISKILADLSTRRQKADYEINEKITIQEVKKSLGQGKKVLDDLTS